MAAESALAGMPRNWCGLVMVVVGGVQTVDETATTDDDGDEENAVSFFVLLFDLFVPNSVVK